MIAYNKKERLEDILIESHPGYFSEKIFNSLFVKTKDRKTKNDYETEYTFYFDEYETKDNIYYHNTKKKRLDVELKDDKNYSFSNYYNQLPKYIKNDAVVIGYGFLVNPITFIDTLSYDIISDIEYLKDFSKIYQYSNFFPSFKGNDAEYIKDFIAVFRDRAPSDIPFSKKLLDDKDFITDIIKLGYIFNYSTWSDKLKKDVWMIELLGNSLTNNLDINDFPALKFEKESTLTTRILTALFNNDPDSSSKLPIIKSIISFSDVYENLPEDIQSLPEILWMHIKHHTPPLNKLPPEFIKNRENILNICALDLNYLNDLDNKFVDQEMVVDLVKEFSLIDIASINEKLVDQQIVEKVSKKYSGNITLKEIPINLKETAVQFGILPKEGENIDKELFDFIVKHQPDKILYFSFQSSFIETKELYLQYIKKNENIRLEEKWEDDYDILIQAFPTFEVFKKNVIREHFDIKGKTPSLILKLAQYYKEDSFYDLIKEDAKYDIGILNEFKDSINFLSLPIKVQQDSNVQQLFIGEGDYLENISQYIQQTNHQFFVTPSHPFYKDLSLILINKNFKYLKVTNFYNQDIYNIVKDDQNNPFVLEYLINNQVLNNNERLNDIFVAFILSKNYKDSIKIASSPNFIPRTETLEYLDKDNLTFGYSELLQVVEERKQEWAAVKEEEALRNFAKNNNFSL